MFLFCSNNKLVANSRVTNLHIYVHSQLNSIFDIMSGTIDPVGRDTLFNDRAFVVFAIITLLDSPPTVPSR